MTHFATKPRRSSANLDQLNARGIELLKPITAPGINPYKRVELYIKYRPVVPEDYWDNELYVKPPEEILRKFKEEKVIQKDNRTKVKALKEEGGDMKGGGGDADSTKEKINNMTIAQLKVVLKIYGLTVGAGLKADLQARLNAHLLGESNLGGTTTLLVPASGPTDKLAP